MQTASSTHLPVLNRWRSGNTGIEGVWHFAAACPGRHLLVTALVHGNEPCGARALLGLLASGLRPQAGRLTLAFCNLAAFDRHDPARPDAARAVEADLNRQWSIDRLRAGRTLEARRARELQPVVDAADWLLDLHSMHVPGTPLCLAGPQPRNRALARRMASPVQVVVDDGHPGGIRLRDYGRFGRPDAEAPDACALLVECGGHGARESVLVARDQCARMLLAAGLVDAATVAARLPGWLRAGPRPAFDLVVTGALRAPRRAALRLVSPWTALARVPRTGTVVGELAGDAVTTPHDDCVLVMPAQRVAEAGATVLRFARRQPASPLRRESAGIASPRVASPRVASPCATAPCVTRP